MKQKQMVCSFDYSRLFLDMSDGFEDFGWPNWKLLLCLLLAWVLVFLILTRGIQSVGKVSQVLPGLHWDM